jgi:DNA-binding transcriptional LysR family regulator
MDRLRAIEVFVETVTCGSFAGAARKLHTSRAMVSRYIQQLEEHLSAQLFNRTTRRLMLTEVGEDYLTTCRRILAELADADAAASQLQAEPRGTLKISAPTSFGNLCLAPIVAEFILSYPDITVSLVLRRSSFSMIELADSGADIAVCFASHLTDTNFICRKIGEDQWVVCASPSYLERRGVPETPSDLANHNCLLTRGAQSGDVWRFMTATGRVPVKVGGSLISNIIAARAAAVAGAGIALLPTYCVHDDLARGNLVQICSNFGLEKRSIYALYPASRHTPRKVRVFLDFLAARLKLPAPDSMAKLAANS